MIIHNSLQSKNLPSKLNNKNKFNWYNCILKIIYFIVTNKMWESSDRNTGTYQK